MNQIRKCILASLSMATLLVLACGAAAPQEAPDSDFFDGASESTVTAPDSGAEVLRRATSLFPSEPLELFGSLILRKQSGVIVKELPFSMALDWGATPATAKYAIMDAFGRNMAELSVTRSAKGDMTLDYRDGDGNQTTPPSLSSSIFGTDITWLDITFAYLWWSDATLVGSETYKGSLCDIVEVHPPSRIEGCSAVRLWIDRKHGFLRQAEQIGDDGDKVRWMWVASVGKINGRWMIRNLEVKRPGTGMQTKLHVDDLEQL